MPLQIQVAGKHLGIFIDAAILDHRTGDEQQFAVDLQAMGEEENLGMKAPGLHVLVEIRQVGIFSDRFKEGLPTEVFRKQTNQGGFAHPDISRNRNEFFHWLVRQFAGQFLVDQ